MAKNFKTVKEIRNYSADKYSAYYNLVDTCGMSSLSDEGKAKMEVFSILVDVCDMIDRVDDLLIAVFEEFLDNNYSDSTQQMMRSWLHYNMDIDVSKDFFR